MSVVRAWNQLHRREEFGVVIGIATNPKYMYVRVTSGRTKRFRRDRCTLIPSSRRAASPLCVGVAPPDASSFGDAAAEGAPNVP